MATLSQIKGWVKDTQGMLRHARLPTTTDVHMQVIPEGGRQIINSMHDELRNRHYTHAHKEKDILLNKKALGTTGSVVDTTASR